MSHHAIYDEDFFAEHERPLRKQVGEWIDRLGTTTGKSHSLLWRKAYLELEERTGFRVPAKKGLDAVEGAGLMYHLLEIVKNLSGKCGDYAEKVNNAIPDYVPYQSDRSGWKCGHSPASGIDNAIPDCVPHESDRSKWKTKNGGATCSSGSAPKTATYMKAQQEKQALRTTMAEIDWDASEDSEGRTLVQGLIHVMHRLEEQAQYIRQALDALTEGSAGEDTDILMDDISFDLAGALKQFDDIRANLF